MGKEEIKSQGEQDKGVIKYTANLEGVTFFGIIDFPWHGEKKYVLRMDGFNFGVFGNKFVCDRERFSEMAQKIAEVKKESDKGNQLPYFKFMRETFFIK